MEKVKVELVEENKELSVAEMEYLYDLLTYRHNTLVIGGGEEDTHELVKIRLIAKRIQDILKHKQG